MGHQLVGTGFVSCDASRNVQQALPMSDVTRILHATRQGDPQGGD
jgi:hypothetical protein